MEKATKAGRIASIKISAILLAAGESKRMGAENKLLLSLDGRPMVNHVAEALVEAMEVCTSISECIVVLGHEAAAVRQTLASLPVRFVENSRFKDGMGTSIDAGVAAAAPDSSGYMICLSDMPLITSAEYRQLADAFCERYALDHKAIVVPIHQERRGNPVQLSSFYKPAIQQNPGTEGCRKIVKDNHDHVYPFPVPFDHVLKDVDTPGAFRSINST